MRAICSDGSRRDVLVTGKVLRDGTLPAKTCIGGIIVTGVLKAVVIDYNLDYRFLENPHNIRIPKKGTP